MPEELVSIVVVIVIAVVVGFLVIDFRKNRSSANARPDSVPGAEVSEKRERVTPQPLSDIDAELRATPISRDRMDLFWLDRGVLRMMETVFDNRDKYSNIVGLSVDGPYGVNPFESIVGRINAGAITADDIDWALSVDAIAAKAEDAGQAGNYVKAIDLYRQALRHAPGCDLFLMSMGSCYAGLDQLGAALRYMKRAAEINPKNPQIAGNLASCKAQIAARRR